MLGLPHIHPMILLLLFQGLIMAYSNKCYPWYHTDRWYIGRINVGGLCNTLFSVYGQVPLALLFNASLVVSDMYSRHSFAEKWESFVNNPITLPFSSFYDLHKFAAYLKEHKNLTIIEVLDRETCFNNSKIFDITNNNAGNSDSGVLTKLELSGISKPLNSNVQLIRVSPSIMVWRFYDFWQSNQHLKLLQAVHQSLHPAKSIQQRINSVSEHFSHQNLSYWASHLRLEPDVVRKSDANDSHFRSILDKQRQFILSSKCYQKAIEQNISLPGLYASSGIFQYSSHHNILFHRAVMVVTMLRELGFNTIHHGHYDETMYAEQQALADLYISKQAECFIPCYMENPGSASSFSYMVLRLRQLDSVKELRMEHRADISDDYRVGYSVFAGWGF